jgi:hypothetical protein
MGVEAGKVSPSFYLSVERFVNIEGNVCDAGANPIVVKVHLEEPAPAIPPAPFTMT